VDGVDTCGGEEGGSVEGVDTWGHRVMTNLVISGRVSRTLGKPRKFSGDLEEGSSSLESSGAMRIKLKHPWATLGRGRGNGKQDRKVGSRSRATNCFCC
jgi:hypothetical protein